MEIEIKEDCVMRIFTEFNRSPTGTGYDKELGKYSEITYVKGTKIEGEIMDIKGKYLNIQFPDGSVGVCVPHDVVTAEFLNFMNK